MVGVPGVWSKGCGTCRKRKIKVGAIHALIFFAPLTPFDPSLIDSQCDLQRPKCGQCTRSSRECQGYAQHNPFVNYAGPATITNATPIATPALATGRTAGNQPKLSWDDASDPEDDPFQAQSSSGQTTGTEAYLAQLVSQKQTLRGNTGARLAVNPRAFSLTAFESQLVDQFFGLYYPRSNLAQPEQRFGFLVPQSEVVRSIAQTQLEPLRLAFLAVCLTRVGQYKNDRQLTDQSMRHYGKALYQLNTLLSDSTKNQDDDAALACQLCGMYEVSLPNNQGTV